MPRLTATATAAALALLLVAAGDTTAIHDECGGGLRPISDICAIIVEPSVIEHEDQTRELEAVTFTLVVDADTADWKPGDMWDLMWSADGCTTAIRWFHDPGRDLPGELTTRLDRTCGDGLVGFEVEPPTLEGRTLSTTLTRETLQEVDPSIGHGATLGSLLAHTYLGVGMQTPIYPYVQATRESDDTTPQDVELD